MALMLVRLLFVARLLDTSAFGQFSAGLLVSTTFYALGSLGLQAVLYRDLPIMIVRGRARTGVVLVAQCIIVACGCAGVGVIFALAGWSVAGLSAPLLVISLLHGWSQQTFMVACAEVRSRGDPLGFARQSFARSIAVLGAGATVAAVTASPAWTLLVEAVASLLVARAPLTSAFRSARISAPAAYRLALHRLPQAPWRSAGALFALGWVGFVISNADRWIGAEWLSASDFAHYAFAWTVLMVAQSGQLLVNASVFPLLARRYAKHGSHIAYRTCVWVSGGLLVLGALLSFPFWVMLDAGIVRWFPAYRPALELIPLFVILAVLRVSDYWTSFMIIVGQEALLLGLNIVAGIVASLGWVIWVRPWQGAIALWDIGLLAVVLGAVNYAVTGAACWLVSRR